MNLETYLYDAKHDFDIVLSVQGNPCVRVIINNQVKYDNRSDTNKIFINCTHMLEKYSSGYIQISMYGKTSRDTVLENDKIVKDTTVTVEDVIINGVSLTKTGQIYEGIYRPIYWDDYTGNLTPELRSARTMGFNGSWTYIWDESPIRHIINNFEKVDVEDINKNMQQIFSTLDIR